jgi:hypothetical protein
MKIIPIFHNICLQHIDFLTSKSLLKYYSKAEILLHAIKIKHEKFLTHYVHN